MSGRFAWARWGRWLLVSSLLMQQHGFAARPALARIRITHPPAGPPCTLACRNILENNVLFFCSMEHGKFFCAFVAWNMENCSVLL
jgi:hypothetical protein